MDELITNDKAHDRKWIKERHGKSTGLASILAPTQTYLDDLIAKIRQKLEVEFEEKVNEKIQDNISLSLKKMGKANPNLNMEIGEFCDTLLSEEKKLIIH